MAQFGSRNGHTPDAREPAAAAQSNAGQPDPEEQVPEKAPGLFQIHKTFSAFNIPAYRVLWFSTIVSLMGMQMQMVGRGILAYEIGGTNSAIAITSLAWGLPMALFSLVGGTLADRFNRRKVMMTSQSCTMVIALTIAVLVHTDSINLLLLFLLGLVQGTVFSFGGPARQSFIAEVVGDKQLMNAIALNQAGMNLTRIVGPSVAGVMASIAFIDLQGLFYAQASLNVISLILLFVLQFFPTNSELEDRAAAREPGFDAEAAGQARERPQKGSIKEEFLNGLRYIVASPILLTLLVMGLVPSLIGMNYQTFLPVFAKDVFGDGVGRNSQALGVMMTMTGVGALIGALVVAAMQDYPRRTQLQLFAGLAFGLSLAFFAVQGGFALALIGLTCLGFAATFFQALNSTMIMSSSDPNYYGRVMSVNMMTFALMPLGAIPLGLLADLVGSVHVAGMDLAGVQVTQFGAGILVAVFILLVTVRNPAYRRLEQDDFKHFATMAADRVRDDGGGSAWNQLGRAMRQERGSRLARRLADTDGNRIE